MSLAVHFSSAYGLDSSSISSHVFGGAVTGDSTMAKAFEAVSGELYGLDLILD